MIDLLYGYDRDVANWVQVRLPEIRNGFGACTAIGVTLDGAVIAGVVYHEYRGHMMQLSIAADSQKWATRKTLRHLLGYPFLQCHVARITACVAKGNKRSRSLVERLGFKLEGTIRRGFDGQKDLLVYGMLREEANKWIAHERQPESATST